MDSSGLLDVARREIGAVESPAGSNRTKYGAWFGLDGNPWCMMFVQWCFAQAGTPLPARTASCGALMRAAKPAGQWVASDLRPGDVVLYDFSGRRRTTEHCGIVEAVLPDGGVQAIEGNTSEGGSQSNGGMVCRKRRAGRYVVGAVRPRFQPEEKEESMTGKEIYDALSAYLRGQPLPAWAEDELAEAVRLGVTDGEDPMALIPRYQAAIMAKRAACGQPQTGRGGGSRV